MPKGLRKAAAALLVTLIVGGPVHARPAEDRSDNIARIASFAYEKSDRSNMDVGGTDLAFDGSYIYAAEQGREGLGGGLHIYRATAQGAQKMSFISCGGWQNDVAVVKPGLVAIGYHKGKVNCGSKNGGITFVDVKDPRRPRLLGSTPENAFPSTEKLGGVHTVTVLPGSNLVYASPGGTTTQDSTQVTVIDASDPRQPRVKGVVDTKLACHDLTFWSGPERTLGFCTGWGATQVWDMTDPLAPSVQATIVNPLHAFHHSSAVTSDGQLLVVGTETVGNECVGGPSGALVAYDISDPAAPTYKGFFGAQRGSSRVYNGLTDPNFETLCAAHLFNFAPNSRTLVSGNGSGGVSVVDFTDPTSPKETSHYMSDDMPIVISAYWHKGRIYSNGLKSFDVFKTR